MTKRAYTAIEAAILANILGTGAGTIAGAIQTPGTGGDKAKGAIKGGILAGTGAGVGGLASIPISAALRGKAGLPLMAAGALAGGYGGYKLKDHWK